MSGVKLYLHDNIVLSRVPPSNTKDKATVRLTSKAALPRHVISVVLGRPAGQRQRKAASYGHSYVMLADCP